MLLLQLWDLKIHPVYALKCTINYIWCTLILLKICLYIYLNYIIFNLSITVPKRRLFSLDVTQKLCPIGTIIEINPLIQPHHLLNIDGGVVSD
jgi:hypothetical protein